MSESNRRLTLSLALLVAGLFVIAIGAQAYVAQRDNAERDAAAARQDAADRRYADCLTKFAADLVDAIRLNRDANLKLIRAGERKDKALDRLITLSARAQASGAQTQAELDPDLLAAYEAALRERVDAQRAYNRIKADARKTRKSNPYVSPKVVCER